MEPSCALSVVKHSLTNNTLGHTDSRLLSRWQSDSSSHDNKWRQHCHSYQLLLKHLLSFPRQLLANCSTTLDATAHQTLTSHWCDINFTPSVQNMHHQRHKYRKKVDSIFSPHPYSCVYTHFIQVTKQNDLSIHQWRNALTTCTYFQWSLLRWYPHPAPETITHMLSYMYMYIHVRVQCTCVVM